MAEPDMGSDPAIYRPLGGDLPVANRFLFELDLPEIGLQQIGVFREVQGLEVTVNTVEVREGGQNGYVHRLPGRMTWPNIVFRRGLTDSNVIFDWMARTSGEGFATQGNKVTRLTGAVTAIDFDTNKRLRKWEFYDVMPVRWKGPEFKTDSDAALEEELEITHNGFKASTP